MVDMSTKRECITTLLLLRKDATSNRTLTYPSI